MLKASGTIHRYEESEESRSETRCNGCLTLDIVATIKIIHASCGYQATASNGRLSFTSAVKPNWLAAINDALAWIKEIQMIWTIKSIQAAMVDSRWWDADTMAFFGTRVESVVFNGPSGVYFVTSEKPPFVRRRYTVRQFNPSTARISDFGKYTTQKTAIRHAKGLAE